MDVGPIFIDFCTQRNMAEVPKVAYVLHFWHFFDFWLLCCWDDLLIDFWSIFVRFSTPKSIKNQAKINQQIIPTTQQPKIEKP